MSSVLDQLDQLNSYRPNEPSTSRQPETGHGAQSATRPHARLSLPSRLFGSPSPDPDDTLAQNEAQVSTNVPSISNAMDTKPLHPSTFTSSRSQASTSRPAHDVISLGSDDDSEPEPITVDDDSDLEVTFVSETSRSARTESKPRRQLPKSESKPKPRTSTKS